MDSRIAAMYGRLAKALNDLEAEGEGLKLDEYLLPSISGLSGRTVWSDREERWYVVQA